jgi:hypothetical protein
MLYQFLQRDTAKGCGNASSTQRGQACNGFTHELAARDWSRLLRRSCWRYRSLRSFQRYGWIIVLRLIEVHSWFCWLIKHIHAHVYRLPYVILQEDDYLSMGVSSLRGNVSVVARVTLSPESIDPSMEMA